MSDAQDTPIPPDQSWIADTGVTRRQALAGTVVAASYALAAQPLSATAIATPDDGLDAGMITFPTGGIQMGAYRAKPKARAAANGRIDRGDLTAVLCLLGIPRSDWREG